MGPLFVIILISELRSTETTAMAALDRHRHVYFTPESPVDVPPNALVIYDVVEPEALVSSSVLACIAESGGQARLPDAVTLSEFKTWTEAVTAGEETQKCMAIGKLCTIAKV